LRLRRRAFVADGSFLERIGLPHSILRNEPSGMYHTTGFTRDEIVGLCARVHAVNEAAAESDKVTWPPILGLFTSVVVTLTQKPDSSRDRRVVRSIAVHYQPCRHGPDAAAGHHAGTGCARGRGP
jgi:hypothetical protein